MINFIYFDMGRVRTQFIFNLSLLSLLEIVVSYTQVEANLQHLQLQNVPNTSCHITSLQ